MDIIAEIGSSPAPEWDFDVWCRTVAQTGATHVKAQVFIGSHFPPPYDELKRPLEFPRARLAEFARTAHAYGLAVGASVFDSEAVELVARELDFLKLAAREQDNHALISDVMRYYETKPIYRSLSDVEYASSLEHIHHLYAVQEYPAGMIRSLYLLRWWCWWSRRAGLAWGWSSHTVSDFDCRLAARLGASVIEKHIAIAPTDIEAGHSLLPEAFGRMVERCRKE